jgi:hypothetical protein
LRERAVRLLCDAFAEDRLSIDEFERRLDAAHGAASIGELRGLLEDLPVPASVHADERRTAVSGPAAHDVLLPSRHATLPADRVREQSVTVAVLGGVNRSAGWVPARTNWVISTLGGAQIDFRDVPVPPGVTELRLFAFCGGADVIVPPEIRVECSGSGILGGFDVKSRTPTTEEADAPLLRISGLAVMGGISVSVRHPGESARDARKRIRRERRARKRLRGRDRG